MNKVDLLKVAKDIERLPFYIAIKLQKWSEQVEMLGISEVRKYLSYHDEPLHGDRVGQRSIRLSKSYRAIYLEYTDADIKWIVVLEVSKHKY